MDARRSTQTIGFRHLRYFVAVAEELHFARAGARLGIEQSPLSRQIQDLECQLKVRLFERSRRSTRLTEAGERFVLDARRILADVEDSSRALRAFAAGEQPLRVGLAEGIAGPAFGRLLHLCRNAQPAIAIILTERPAAELVRSALSGGLDAIIGPEPTTMADLECALAWTEELVVVAPSTLENDRGSIWLKSLSTAEPWLVPDPQTLPGYARQIEALLSQKDLTLRSNTAITSPATLIRLVGAGAGLGLLPASLIDATGEVSYLHLHDEDAIVTSWLTTRRDDPSPVLAAFKHLVGSASKDQPPVML